MRFMDATAGRRIVQILNGDETRIHAIVLGIPEYRLSVAQKPEIVFHESAPGASLPIRAWFYPGQNYGVEFVYPKKGA
jgi:hypothetical protein